MKSFVCFYIVNNKDGQIFVLSTDCKKAYNIAIKSLSHINGLESLMIKEVSEYGR